MAHLAMASISLGAIRLSTCGGGMCLSVYMHQATLAATGPHCFGQRSQMLQTGCILLKFRSVRAGSFNQARWTLTTKIHSPGCQSRFRPAPSTPSNHRKSCKINAAMQATQKTTCLHAQRSFGLVLHGSGSISPISCTCTTLRRHSASFLPCSARWF